MMNEYTILMYLLTRTKQGILNDKPEIIGASEEELRPTEEARQELQRLLTWEKRSEKRDWVVGQPFIK